MSSEVLAVKNLKTHFFTRRGVSKAVDGISFSVKEGETLGVVGESGSGKTISCMSILRLVPEPSGRIVGGEIILNGEDLLKKSEKEMRRIRGKQISIILQDPMSSLNPVFTIGEQVAWPIALHQKLPKNEIKDKVKAILASVKIPSPEVRMREYPHQMSGGMRQRIVGAMALSCLPQLLIADEPTTALDMTIQAQFLKLIKEIQAELNLAMIMVTHDFGIVAKTCDQVAVMYAGRIVETAPVRDIFNHPRHPYTQALMASLPQMDKDVELLYSIKGQPPDLRYPPPGCRFAPRCDHCMSICEERYPPVTTINDSHSLNCWLKNEKES